MKKEDRRVTKSKTKIREGLLELLEEKKLSSITVIELTSRANVNRKTFYNHYSGVYDVVHEMEDECLERFKEIFSKDRVYTYKVDVTELYDRLLKEVTQNEYFYRVMTHSDIHSHFAGKLVEGVREWLKTFEIKDKNVDMVMLEYYYDYLTAGTLDVIHRWLLSDNKISQSYLAKFFSAMSMSTEVKKFFNVFVDKEKEDTLG